ncbi:MAG: CHAD domain-containing protein [Burkholderiaceae bacterium]
MASEIEICFALTGNKPPAARELSRWPLLGGATHRVQTLTAVYFDTADALLARHRVGLRIRREAGRWQQTLKAEGDGLERLEIQHTLTQKTVHPIPAIDPIGLPDRAQLASLGFKKSEAAQLSDSAALAPLFTVCVRRTIWQVELGSSRLEVAYDLGTIETDSDQRPIAEIEIELLSGQRTDLFAACQSLSVFLDGIGRLACLEPRSKAQRGLMLLYPESSFSGLPKAKATGETGLVLSAHLLRATQVLATEFWKTLETSDPEGPHQARVALRQIRTILKLLASATSEANEESLLTACAALADALGELRDLDVAMEKVVDPINRALETDPDVSAALQQAQAARELIRDRIREQLCQQSVRSLLVSLMARSDALATQHGLPPAAVFAKAQAQQLLRRVSRRKRQATHVEGRHRLRLAYKALRYATPVLLQLGADPTLALEAKKAARAQDKLGDDQDRAVMLQTLTRHLAGEEQNGRHHRFLTLAKGFLIGRN